VLLGRLADPTMPPFTDVLPTEVVIRGSCGCPPARQQGRA
jgi:hypothetical protein